MPTKIDHLILAYRNNELTKEEADLLARWLEESEEHRSYFKTRLAQVEPVVSAQAEQAWSRFAARNKILFAPSQPQPNIRRRRFLPYLAAATLLAGICTVWFWAAPKSDPKVEQDSVAAEQPLKYQTAPGERLDIVLPDGSKVCMNSEAVLTVDPQFGEKTREIEFDGEAFFSISPNKNCPFIIHCGKDCYTVLGTSFNLQSYMQEKYSVVTLHTGRLQAQIKEDVIILEPNEELQVDAATNTITKRSARVSDSIGWIDGKLIFSGNPLKDVANKLSRHYQVPINIHEEIANLKYTGTVDRETLPEALEMIAETSPIRLSITNIDGEYYLSRAKQKN